jgi:hypothetical protein
MMKETSASPKKLTGAHRLDSVSCQNSRLLARRCSSFRRAEISASSFSRAFAVVAS